MAAPKGGASASTDVYSHYDWFKLTKSKWAAGERPFAPGFLKMSSDLDATGKAQKAKVLLPHQRHTAGLSTQRRLVLWRLSAMWQVIAALQKMQGCEDGGEVPCSDYQKEAPT